MTTLELPPMLDTRAAGPLLQSLTQVRGAALLLDASGVERMGALCLQVLMAAQAQWRADAMDFTVTKPSPAFADAVSMMNVTDLCIMDVVS